MQTSCLARRGSIRPWFMSRAFTHHTHSVQRTRSILRSKHDVGNSSQYTRFFSSISMCSQPSKRRLLFKLAPGLWMYNNSGLYGGEAAVAVNHTTQHVILQRSVAGLSPATMATTSPYSRGVDRIMNHLSKGMIKGTALILSTPQPKTSLQGTGLRGFTQLSPHSMLSRHSPPTQSSRVRLYQTTMPRSCLAESRHPVPIQCVKSTHCIDYARTKLAPSCMRSRANSQTIRSFATGTGRGPYNPSQSALVKYTAPTGPLDRVDRAKLLSAAPNFMARLKIRLKLLLMRQIRPWRVDDFIAMFSWAFLANIAFVLLGTTTFFSLLLATANSLQFQGFVASKISDYLTASTGVKVKFEAAIVPNWKDGRITLRNVVMSKRAEEPKSSHSLGHKGEDHSGHGHEHDHDHDHDGAEHGNVTEEEIDNNFTMFDLTIDQIDVTLSAKRWLDGKGLIEDASIKGVRGVIDRTYVWWDPDVEYIPEEARRKHVQGDFELESLQLEDMKQWLFYDMLCAESMVGMFDGCLFSCYTAQRENTDNKTDSKWKRMTRFKIDDVKIDHLNAGVEGPFGWIYAGTVDITCDVKIPNEPREDVLRKLVNDFVDKIDEVVDFAPLPLVIGTGAVGGKEFVMYPNRAAAALHQKMMEEEEEQRRPAQQTGQTSSAKDEHNRLHQANRQRYLQQQQQIEQQLQYYQQQLEQNLQHLTEQQRLEHKQDMSKLIPKPKSKRPAIVMEFEFRFNNTKASIPLQTESISYLSNAMIRPIVAFLNNNRTVTPIRCHLEMDLSEFDGSWTVYDSNLMDNLSTELGKAWANLVADERERNRKLKRVGLWGLQSMTRNIVSVYDYARGNRGFWHYIGTQTT